MKHTLIIAVAFGFLSTQLRAEDQPALKDQKEKVSYIIGREMGANMKEHKIEVSPDLVIAGFRDGFTGKKSLVGDVEAKEIMDNFEKEMQTRMEKDAKEMTGKNKMDGEKFLAENKTKEGVKTLPSGMQYKVLREGAGASPKASDHVTTHYRGTLIDGTEFDSSYKRNEPTSFGVSDVIPGWQEALQLMKPGAKWQLYIPSNLAYGENGAGGVIGPNATLIFDIELISIDKR